MLVGVAFGGFSLLMGRLLGPHHPDMEKNAQYECGFPAFDDARVKFDVRYYLIAILFILLVLFSLFIFRQGNILTLDCYIGHHFLQ